MSRKPCELEAARRRLEHRLECVASGTVIVPGKRMCAGRRVDAAFGHVRDHRRDDRVAERARDLLGQRLDAHVVLAERHVRAVLLGAADRHDDVVLPARICVAQLGRRQVLEEHRRWRVATRPPAARAAASAAQTQQRKDRIARILRDGPCRAITGARRRRRPRAQPRLVRGLVAQQDVVVRAHAVDERHRHAAARVAVLRASRSTRAARAAAAPSARRSTGPD